MNARARHSIEEYDRIIQCGVFDWPHRRHIELIHGDLRERSPIGPPHEETVDVLSRWSIDHAPRERVRVRIQNSIGLPSHQSVPEPDVAWVTRQQYSERRPVAEEVLLLIEVADTSLQYDLGEKADLYATAGIPDYWVVDLINERVEVLRDPDQGRYRERQTFRDADTIYPLAFPQLGFPVSILFDWS